MPRSAPATAATSTAMTAETDRKPDDRARLRAANLRTALVLASIAAVFFVGIIASKFLGAPSTSISVIGAAVLLFLIVAIGRNLRR